MPSVNSSSRPNVWPSSTFTTPSLPTFSIASERTSPISRSREETVATRAMSSLTELSLDCDFRFSTTASTAFSMPRLRALVLEDVLDLDLACDRDAVVRDRRSAELLVEHDIAPLRAKGDLDRVGEDVHATLERAACVLVELQLLVSHVFVIPPVLLGLRAGQLAVANDLGEHVRLTQDQNFVGPELDLGSGGLAEDEL